ncbi:MAG: hypothetical protein AAB380_01380 [Verrucomicrobiota bacterium]
MKTLKIDKRFVLTAILILAADALINLKVHFPVKHGPSPRQSGFGHAGGVFSRVRATAG